MYKGSDRHEEDGDKDLIKFMSPSGVPRNFFRGRGGGRSTNSVEDRGQRERGSGGGSP
jgi:hypothetical protein